MLLSLLLCSLTSPLFRYTQNGILHMLDRNKRIKSKPERFQSCKDKFDLVITCEERVYDQVLEGEASYKKCVITEEICWSCGAPCKNTALVLVFVGIHNRTPTPQLFAQTKFLLPTLLIVWHTLSFFNLLSFPRFKFKRAGDSTACARHQRRHSG